MPPGTTEEQCTAPLENQDRDTPLQVVDEAANSSLLRRQPTRHNLTKNALGVPKPHDSNCHLRLSKGIAPPM